MGLLRRILYGRKVFECGRCHAQFEREVEYESHYRREHVPEELARTDEGPYAEQLDPETGRWEPAIPLPGYFRERKMADW